MTTERVKEITQYMDRIVNVRDYEDQFIPEKVINDLLYSFSLGPSLANCQPWELIVLDQSSDKEKAVEASLDPFLTEGTHGTQKWLKQAPFVAVVCLEKRRAQTRIGERGDLFAIEDVFTAVQNFRLVASLHGLATSVVREFDSERLKTNLDIPWYVEPLAILTAGYSSAVLEIPERFGIQDFVHWGRWK